MRYTSETDQRTAASPKEKTFQVEHLQPVFNRRADDRPGRELDHPDSMEMISALLCETVESLKICLEEIAQTQGKMVDAKIKRAHVAVRNADFMDRITKNG